MSEPWLDVVGIGEDGLAGLSPAARAALEAAGVVMGGDRWPELPIPARRIGWPKALGGVAAALRAERANRPVMLVTGDPLWYSVGARLLKEIPGEEIRYHPALSVFQRAAAEMRWSLADVETLALLRRSPDAAIRHFAPGARLLVLVPGAEAAPALARLLTDNGYGESRIVALHALGGPKARRIEGRARDWSAPCPDFITLAVECRADPGAALWPRLLPDAALAGLDAAPEAARAAALAFLWPRRGARLLAFGPGAAALAIDWLRAARDAEATVIGAAPDGVSEQAAALGAPRLAVAESASGAFDAVFHSGLPEDLAGLKTRLAPSGRLLVEARGRDTDRLPALGPEGEALRIMTERAGPKGWEGGAVLAHWRFASS